MYDLKNESKFKTLMERQGHQLYGDKTLLRARIFQIADKSWNFNQSINQNYDKSSRKTLQIKLNTGKNISKSTVNKKNATNGSYQCISCGYVIDIW